MSEIFQNNINTFPQSQPYIYNTGQKGVQNVQTQTPQVKINTPYTSQIYQYPTTSVYSSNQTENNDSKQKQAASGVNIYIYNPAGMGAPCATANATYTLPNAQNASQPLNYTDTPIASTGMQTMVPTSGESIPINITSTQTGSTKPKEKKTVVELTDNYIKTLESYLRSNDQNIRKTGIIDLIRRFEEDPSRRNDPALTALINIALQDPISTNRQLALSPIAAEQVQGDEKTVELLKSLQQSNKIFGRESQLATEALLKTTQLKSKIDKE